jgi:hypothetical protein
MLGGWLQPPLLTSVNQTNYMGLWPEMRGPIGHDKELANSILNYWQYLINITVTLMLLPRGKHIFCFTSASSFFSFSSIWIPLNPNQCFETNPLWWIDSWFETWTKPGLNKNREKISLVWLGQKYRLTRKLLNPKNT